MRTRKEMKEELSEMRFNELRMYEQVLLKNKSMGVTHLESMEVNDLQLEIVDELIKASFNPRWKHQRNS